MRVAVVGLGDIAQKAYLPVLAADSAIRPVLVTRDPHRLATLGDRYRVPDRFAEVGEALDTGLDAAFVHTATESHPAVVSALLERGVPTYVDKPLASSYAAAERLVALATERAVPLAVGFNRRWAPAYRELAGWPDRDVVILQKHRAGGPGDPRRVVFDDFVHVVDTLRFLLDGFGPDDVEVTARVDAAGLHRVSVHVRAGQRLAVGVMNRAGGLTQEVLEVVAPGRHRRVVDLAEVVDHDGAERVTRRDEWVPVAEQRGFTGICAAFLDAVRAGRPLRADDALVTHAVCERVVERVAALAGASRGG